MELIDVIENWLDQSTEVRMGEELDVANLSQDTPLASLWVYGRTVRLADGPDEVHLYQLGRNLIKQHGWNATSQLS